VYHIVPTNTKRTSDHFAGRQIGDELAAGTRRCRATAPSAAPTAIRSAAVTALVIALFTLSGCGPDRPASSPELGESTSSLQQRADRGEVLFGAVVEQLRNLASFVDVELRPPVVILDARKSGDEQDVLAVFGAHPDVPDGPNNYVVVTSGNGRFRSLGVRPGDILKYSFVRYDLENMETDVGETVTLDLTVAQVPHENALIIEGGLSQPVPVPQKIEIWRYVDDRLNEITRELATYIRFRRPVFDWEPSPDKRALTQIVERLNQWMRQSQPKATWSPPELLSTLDPALAADERLAPLISAAALADRTIQPYEGRLLQEAVWHRDVSRWAQGDSFDDVARASALFDWTVRNIQLDEVGDNLPQRPWQTLLYGHGTAAERAWVFALLCRQQGLDVVMLSVPETAEPPVDDAADEAEEPVATSRFWLPALLSEGELYLFDMQLGLPIPGPDGEGIAMLKQIGADESLLRALDLENDPYSITAAQLAHVTADVVADPFDVSQRAEAVEAKLSGDDRTILTSRADELAAKLSTVADVSGVQVWEHPFRVWRDQLRIRIAARQRWARAFEPFARRPTLWKARVLHFQGHRSIGADAVETGFDEVANDHDEAVRIYTSRSVRPPDRQIAQSNIESERRIHATAKENASYWVGLLSYDQGKFASAENWFAHPQLSGGVDSPWADGTRYNLARTYEAEGKLDEAIALYEADDSPQRHGNRLRAKRLRMESAKPQAIRQPADAATDDGS
jgi:tetratricopeptide (TPR) repeat protein